MILPTLEEVLREKKRRKLKSSLKEFTLWVFEEILKTPFDLNWHHETLFHSLEKVHRGDTKRLVINIPPRYSKTAIAVICFSAWAYANSKRCNFLHVSYGDALALKNSKSVKDIIQHEKFQELFPTTISVDEKSKRQWQIKEGGGFYATSSGGVVTGFGCGTHDTGEFGGALIVDDPHKVGEERFERSLIDITNNFEAVLATRLNNPDETPVILVMQRVHENDLSGHLLSGKSQTGKYDHVCLRAMKESDDDDVRKTGEALWESKHTKDALYEMKKANPSLFHGQYQQRPAPLEGNMVKKSMMRFYSVLPQSIEGRYISCDLNFKKDGVSNCCFSVYFTHKGKIYLVDQETGKWSFSESLYQMRAMITNYPNYNAILIEEKANGAAMIDVLSNEGMHSIVPIKVNQSKTLRLSHVIPYYMSGDVLYPKESDWIGEHIHEMISFPNAKNDDRVDTETQFLNFHRENIRIGNEFLNI